MIKGSLMFNSSFAKARFADVYQRTPWSSRETQEKCKWPFLDHQFAQKRISYFDYILTYRLLRNYPQVGEEVALFFCHLTLAAKDGHLCIKVNDHQLYPPVAKLWQNEECDNLTKEEENILTQLIMKGAIQVPENLITTFCKESDQIPQTVLCRNGDQYYLQRHWILESLVLKFLKKNLEIAPSITLDPEKIHQSIEDLYQNKIVLKEQAQAIFEACMNTVTLITGGPGTGKTYTAGHLIKVFLNHLSNKQKKECEIVLAAPTGKAAANLQRYLSKIALSSEEFPTIQAKTLHSLLGIKQQSEGRKNSRLTADLIIVDESSMIDIKVMASLFESLKPGSRLVLLGDSNQLPSVEAGSVFVDLINLKQSFPQLPLHVIPLSVCLRAELKSLIDFAQFINNGLADEVLDFLKQSNGEGITRFHLSEDNKTAQKEIIHHVLPHFPTIVKHSDTPEQLLELFQAIRLLSPMRKGPLGVETLNRLIWNEICEKNPMNGYLAIPIMITTNDYRQNLFNGETGVLVRRLPLQSLGLEDYAIFPSREEENKVCRFSALLLPKYELAYCLSVHKSQGSEFDRIILVLPEGSELFGREVFYTGVTRARKAIEIYGSDHVIANTVKQRGIRLSGIEKRFLNEKILFESV